MKKYYKIPMTERVVSANGETLFKILQDQYPDLYNRELGRIELTYGGTEPGVMTPQLEEAVNDYNAQTSLLYKAMGVPQYLIAIKEDDKEVKEYVTGTILTAGGLGCLLEGRQVSQTTAYQYLDETPNYMDKVAQLFPKEEKKSLIKRTITAIISKKDN